MANEEKLRSLHKAMSDIYDMEPFEEFVKNMNNPKTRQNAYNALLDDFDMEPFDEFETNLGFSGKPVNVQNPKSLPDNNYIQESKQNNPAWATTGMETTVPTYMTSMQEGNDATHTPTYAPGYGGYAKDVNDRLAAASNNETGWNTGAKPVAKATPVDAVKSGAVESGLNEAAKMSASAPNGDVMMAMTGAMAQQQVEQDKLNAQEMAKVAEAKAANDAKYQEDFNSALRTYGVEEAVGAHEAEVAAQKATEEQKNYANLYSKSVVDGMAPKVQINIDQRTPSQKASDKLSSIQQSSYMKGLSNTYEERAVSEVVDKIFARTGKEENQWANANGNYNAAVSNMLEEDVRDYANKFGIDYDKLSKAKKKEVWDNLQNQLAVKVLSDSRNKGTDLNLVTYISGKALRSFTLLQAVELGFNLIKGSDSTIKARALDEAIAGYEEDVLGDSWYSSLASGGAAGLGLFMDLGTIGGILKYGTGWLKIPSVSSRLMKKAGWSTLATYGPGASGNLLREALLEQPLGLAAMYGSVNMARGYMEFGNLGLINAALQSAGDPERRQEVVNWADDLMSQDGWLKATGQLLYSAADAYSREGIVGAQLGALSGMTSILGNSFANRMARRAFDRSKNIKFDNIETAIRNGSAAYRNYSVGAKLIGAGAEIGYFTKNSIDEQIEMANEIIREHNRNNDPRLAMDEITWATYDKKMSVLLQNVGLIAAMKMTHGVSGFAFDKDPVKQRIKLSNELMKRFGCQLNARDLDAINDLGIGRFSGFNYDMVEALNTERRDPNNPDEKTNGTGQTWYYYVINNRKLPFDTARKLRLAMEGQMTVAGFTVDDNGKVTATMNAEDVVVAAGIRKNPNGRWTLEGFDSYNHEVMSIDYATEKEANAHLEKMNGLIADNMRRQMEMLLGDKNNIIGEAIDQWADENGVDKKHARWMYFDFVSHKETAMEENAAMAQEVRDIVSKGIESNRQRYISEARNMIKERTGYDIDKICTKRVDSLTKDEIDALNAYTKTLLDWKKDLTTDPRILEVENNSDMESGTQKTGIYKGAEVYYIGDLASGNVHVIDPKTGIKTHVNASEVQPIEEVAIPEVIDNKIKTYDPEKGVQEGNIVWTVDNATGEWYQGEVRNYDGDNVEIVADGRITKVMDKSLVDKNQREHAELEQQQILNDAQEGQNQLGEQAGSKLYLDVNGVQKPIRSADERGDMMHVVFEDGTIEDVTFDDYQARLHDKDVEQQQQQEQIEAQKQQKIAEIGGLNTLDDIANWRNGQNGAIDAEVESELLKREKLIRDNNRAKLIQQVGTASLEELDALESQALGDAEVQKAIDDKRNAETQKISDEAYQTEIARFSDNSIENNLALGIDRFDEILSNSEITLEDLREGMGNIAPGRDPAIVAGKIRALEEGIKKMKDARAKYVEEEQNLANIEREEYEKTITDKNLYENNDLEDLERGMNINREVANDNTGRYSKEVVSRAKGRLRAIEERYNVVKEETERFANSDEGKRKSEIEKVSAATTIDELQAVMDNSSFASDKQFVDAYNEKRKDLLVKENQTSFRERVKKGLSKKESDRADDLLRMDDYGAIKSAAKRDDVAKKIVEAIEEKKRAIANDPENMTWEEVDRLFKARNTDKDMEVLFDKVMAVLKGSGFKVSIVDYIDGAYGDEDWDGRVRLELDNIIYKTYGRDEHSSQTLLHELIHGVTSEAIEYIEYTERGHDRYNLHGLQKTFNITEGMKEGAREICEVWDILTRSKQAKGIFPKVPWNKTKWYDNGMKNPNEMIAELANPVFRERLKAMKLWHKVVGGILKMFGIEQKNASGVNTAYEQLYASLEKILDNWVVQEGWKDEKGSARGKFSEAENKVYNQRKMSWADRALMSLKDLREKKYKEIDKSSDDQREIARTNWGDDKLRVVEGLANALGLKLRFVESVADGKANAQIKDGEVLIESTNDNPIKFLMGHEVMHHIRDNAPEVYNAYLKTMRGLIGEKYLEDQLECQRELYRSHKISRTDDQLIEEIVANNSGGLAEDSAMLEQFVQEMADAGKPVVLRKLKAAIDKIDEFMLGLNKKYAGVTADNLAELVQYRTARNRMMSLYKEGLAEAEKVWKEKNLKRMTENENVDKKVAEQLADKGLTIEGGVIMSQDSQELKEATGYKTPNEKTTLDEVVEADLSAKTKDDWRKTYLGRNPSQRHIVIADAIDQWYKNAIMDDEFRVAHGGNAYQDQGTYYNNMNQDGKGPIRHNKEYVWTVDMDTSCPRTYEFLAYRDAIESKIGRFLTLRESQILLEKMRANDSLISCTYCYAENKRQALRESFYTFINARNGVINAGDDYDAAFKAMYGHETKKGVEKLTDAAQKKFDKWRNKTNVYNRYNPEIRELFEEYRSCRAQIMDDLDKMLANGEFKMKDSGEKLSELLKNKYGISDIDQDKGIVTQMRTIANEWRYDVVQGKSHSNMTKPDGSMYGRREARGQMDFRKKATLAIWDEMDKYSKSSSGAKNSVKYFPYTDEITKISESNRKYINGMGGLRMHSSNDFRIDYTGDYLQVIADMAKGRWFGHTYTKSPEFVRIFGNTGYRINMSLAGYDMPDGSISMNEQEGWNWDLAKKMRELYPNAGTMFMTTSDKQLIMALEADWIDMIIPYHSSGLPTDVIDIRRWRDYEDFQSEEFFNTEERIERLKKNGVEVPKKANAEEIEDLFDKTFKIKKLYDNTKEMKRQLNEVGVKPKQGASYDDISALYVKTFGHKCTEKGERVKPHFLPGRTRVGGAKIPGHNNDVARYKKLCEEYGVNPRFYKLSVEGYEHLSDHPNYLKLIKETARTDSKQKAVQFNLDQPNQAYIDELGLSGGVDPSTCKNAWFDEELNGWFAKDPETGEISSIDYSTGTAWTPMAFARDQINKMAGRITIDEKSRDDYGIVDSFIRDVTSWNDAHPGNERPLDFITPEDRKNWAWHKNLYGDLYNLDEMEGDTIEEKMAKQKELEEKASKSDVPYHPYKGDADLSVKDEREKSAEFKKWFGDWEDNFSSASKVVDDEGRPMVVHHYSDDFGFTVFNTNPEDVKGDESYASNIGSHFGTMATAQGAERNMGRQDAKGGYYNVYLNIRNPYQTWDWFAGRQDELVDAAYEIATYIGTDEAMASFRKLYKLIPWAKELEDGKDFEELFYEHAGDKLVKGVEPLFKSVIKEMLTDAGYDGLRYDNWYEGGGESWVALDPRQIKSADTEGAMANNGKFDGSNPDIRYSAKKAEKFEDEMKKVGEDAWKQDFGSGGTSINSNKLPSGFALVDKIGGWSNPGDVVLDMGGGRFDNAVEMLREKGIELLVFDPYNRNAKHNSMVAGRMKDDGADKTICNNCLNVINTAGARANVILQCAKALKPGGTSFFTIYEGNGTGVGKVSKNDCWQENRKTADYLDEIRKYYNDVTTKGKLIIAKDPKQTDELSYWNFNGMADDGGLSFSLKKKAEGSKNVDLIWKDGEDQSEPARAFQVTWPSTGKKNTEERDRKYGVGKRMGGVYFHKDYASDVVPSDVLDKAMKIVPPDFSYNCMYYDEKNPTQLRFDEAPDFDSAREPIPGDMILVDTATGKIVPDSRGKYVRHSDMIWHHKWQWVKDDYKGFDVQDSFDWSVKWKDAFDAQPTGIGSMRVWNEKLASVGLPSDNKIRRGESYADYSKRMLSINGSNNSDDDPDDPNNPGGGAKLSAKDKKHERTGWSGNYGVAYQGSKNQIADALIDVLPKGKRFVDLFSGGGAMSHAMALSGNVESVHMNDKAPFGQQLFLDAMEGKYHDYDRKVTAEEFKDMRYTSEGLMHSFNGNGRSYAADSNKRSKAEEQIRRVKALEQMKDKRDMFTSSELDYRDVELKDGDVIYADIPYENTGNTSYSKAGAFDMKAFTDWAAGLDKPVYVSSFEAPEGFTEIWSSGEMPGFRAGSRKVEKLFVQDRFAEAERKRIEEQQPMTAAGDAKLSVKDDRTKSKNFIKWFGDWRYGWGALDEYVSKVVDEDGKPAVVYHASPAYGFTVFNTDINQKNVGSHFGTEDAANQLYKGNKGIYKVYLNIKRPYETEDMYDNNPAWVAAELKDAMQVALRSDTGKVSEETKKEVTDYLNKWFPGIFRYWTSGEGWKKYANSIEYMENGLWGIGTNEYWKKVESDLGRLLKKVLKERGFDGIKYKNDVEDEGSYSWIAFDSNQIKSAEVEGDMANNGDFDANNPDIRYSLKGEVGAGRLDGIDGGDRMKNLDVAKRMYEDVDNNRDFGPTKSEKRKIKLATGWEIGTDGKWRYETHDPKFDVDTFKEMFHGDTKKLEELCDDKELFDAYPRMKTVKVEASFGLNGGFDKYTGILKLPRFANKDKVKEIFLHEIQHAIQDEEGFAAGSSLQKFGAPFYNYKLEENWLKALNWVKDNLPEDVSKENITKLYRDAVNRKDFVARAMYANIRSELVDGMTRDDIVKLYEDEYNKIVENNKLALDEDSEVNKQAWDKYHRTAGEVEARNVMVRSRMTDEQRRNTLAEETEDVDRDDQIVMFSLKDQIESKNFKGWFGDWEDKESDASKIVDKDGRPRVVYHGTNYADFTEFYAGDGNGFAWFTESKKHAGVYANYSRNLGMNIEPEVENENVSPDGIYPTFLNIRNPFDVGSTDGYCDSEDFKNLASKLGYTPEKLIEECSSYFESGVKPSEKRIWEIVNNPKFERLITSKGYDGVTALEGGYRTYGATRPNQIKSAIANNGDFSSDNNDIQYSLKDPLADNPWTAGKKQRGEGWRQINEMHNFIDSFWNWGQYADADDVKDSVKKLTTFVRGQLTKELGTRIGSARIKTLLSNINKATQKQDLNGPVRTIQRMLNDAEMELELSSMMKLFDIALQKKDSRGVVVPKWVDDNTRKVYDAVRSTYGKMMQTSKDAEIAAKSKEISEKHKAMLEKLRGYGIDPNSWNGTDYSGNNWDALSTADQDELRTMRQDYGALENERQILKGEREQLLLGQNLTETERELVTLRNDLEAREAAHMIDPSAKWTDEDSDMLYVVMPMRERLLSMRERHAELSQLKEAWQAELDALDNIPRGPGFMARRAQQKLVAYAAEDTYIRKQKEICAATREINNAMANILGQGAERLKDWKEQNALHKAHMIRMGLDDYGRKRPLMVGERNIGRSIKNMITAVQDWIDLPLQSLQFILANDQNHLSGQGNLYRYFFSDPRTSIVTAWDNKFDAMTSAGAELDEMVNKIWKHKRNRTSKKQKFVDFVWGGKRPTKNLQTLYGDMQDTLGEEIERFMSQKEVDNNNKHAYKGRTDWTTGDTFKEPMTKGHALYLWLTWRQPDGKMKMAKMGYTDASIAQIEKALGREYLKFGEWITEDFLPRLSDTRYNPRHVEIFGSSMTRNPHYFPLRIDKDQIRPKSGIEDIQSQFMPSLSAPNLISRVTNTTEIDQKADALDVLKDYMESMEQWHAMAPLLRDFNAMHSSQHLKDAMNASHKGSFKTLMEAAQVATASQYRQRGPEAVEVVMKVFNKMLSAGARAHIAFRNMTAVKQLFSYPAFRAYSSDPKFQYDLAKNLVMAPGSIKWARENMPAFRERASKGDMGFEGLNDWDDMDAFVKKYGEKGMFLNKLFDQWAVAAGAKSVYDLKVKRKEDELRRSNMAGLTSYTVDQIKEIAHKWAINEAEICYNQSQQSSRNEFSSSLQKTGNPIVKSLMLFQNANVGYRRQEISNLYNIYKLLTRDVKDTEGYSLSTKKKIREGMGSAVGYMIFGSILHMYWNLAGNTNNLYNYFAGNMTDEEKKKYWVASLLGTFTNGTTLGAPIASLASGYEWEPFEMFNSAKKIVDIVGDENRYDGELEKKLFETLAMYTGGVNLETWENMISGAKDLVSDGGMAPDKAIDFMVFMNMNKTDRIGWAKALMQKYGPVEFAKGYRIAERSKAKNDRTDEMAKSWVMKYDKDFFEEMEGIRKFYKKANDIRERVKKECQMKGADQKKIIGEGNAELQALLESDDYKRWKPFIDGGHYYVYDMLMKSVRSNIRYNNPDGAPANQGTQAISDENLIKELDKVISNSKKLIN